MIEWVAWARDEQGIIHFLGERRDNGNKFSSEHDEWPYLSYPPEAIQKAFENEVLKVKRKF